MINEGNAITEASVGGKKVDDFDDDLSVLVSVTGVDLPVADVDLLVAGVALPVADVDLPVTEVDLTVTGGLLVVDILDDCDGSKGYCAEKNRIHIIPHKK